MKKISDNIEQQYKSQFDDYQHDFDQAAMWHSLDATLPQKSQPKIAAFALASAFVVSILAGALWVNHDTTQANFVRDVVIEKATEIDATAIADGNAVDLNAANALQSKKEGKSIPSNTENSLLEKNTTLTSEEISAYERVGEEASKPISKPKPSFAAVKPSPKSSQMFASDAKIGDLTAIKSVQKNAERLQNHISLLPTLAANAAMTSPNLLQKETMLRDGDLDCPLFGGKKRTQMKGHGFIDLYGEGDVNMTTIKSQNSETNAYQNAWNDTDTPLGSYELGVLLGYEFDNGLYAGLGLEYQKTVEKLEYQQTVIQRVTVWSEEAYFYLDGAGNQVFVADSVTTQSIYERSVKSGKEHTILNLPIMLGYNIHANNWNIGLFGGVNLNLSHKFEGKIINSSNAFVTLDADNYETVYKNKLGASAFAGIHLGRNIGNSIELYFNPTVRIYPKSWMQDDYALSAKYNLAGLRVGLRYKL
ncbi:MAG: hypothetical protein R3E32_28645 [Chitinophagales bacterium]